MATAEQPGTVVRERSFRSSRLPPDWTVRELESHLGVPPERIRLHPPPGMAAAGVELVWLIDRQTRSAKAYSAADRCDVISRDGVLDAGPVLPGFVVSLSTLFQQADEQAGFAESP